MMLPQFKRWLGQLCLFYTRPNWPTEENVADAFRDVKYMDDEALEFIGSYIRTRCEEWPKSISAVMVKGYDAWKIHQAEVKKAEERLRLEREASTVPTPEQWERHKSRLKDVLAALSTGVRPNWMKQRQDVSGVDYYGKGGFG